MGGRVRFCGRSIPAFWPCKTAQWWPQQCRTQGPGVLCGLKVLPHPLQTVRQGVMSPWWVDEVRTSLHSQDSRRVDANTGRNTVQEVGRSRICMKSLLWADVSLVAECFRLPMPQRRHATSAIPPGWRMEPLCARIYTARMMSERRFPVNEQKAMSLPRFLWPLDPFLCAMLKVSRLVEQVSTTWPTLIGSRIHSSLQRYLH